MAAMPIRTRKWPAGVPCWADLTVPDVPAAQAFYAAVLGWSFTDTADEYGGYVIGQVDGAAAGRHRADPAARRAVRLDPLPGQRRRRRHRQA